MKFCHASSNHDKKKVTFSLSFLCMLYLLLILYVRVYNLKSISYSSVYFILYLGLPQKCEVLLRSLCLNPDIIAPCIRVWRISETLFKQLSFILFFLAYRRGRKYVFQASRFYSVLTILHLP